LTKLAYKHTGMCGQHHTNQSNGMSFMGQPFK